MSFIETDPMARAVAMDIAATAALPGLARLLAGETGFHRWFERFQARAVPGLALHQTLRKASLEEAAIHGLDAGIDQVIVLGAGFDTLAARLARRYPRARFLEFDKPSLLAAKRRLLERTGDMPPNLGFGNIDLKRLDVAGCLSHSGFDPGAPAFFLCESLLSNLPPGAVERLLSDLAALPCPALRIAFTFREPDAGGFFPFRGAMRRQARWPLRWKRNRCWELRARDLGGYLAKRGFSLEEIADAAVFRARFLAGNPGVALAEGEKVAIASLAAR